MNQSLCAIAFSDGNRNPPPLSRGDEGYKGADRSRRGGRVFLVCHSPDRLPVDHENVNLNGPESLAEHVVDVRLAT